MYPSDTDWLCCPDCGARVRPTDVSVPPKSLPEHRRSWFVWLVLVAVVLWGSAVWGLAALGLGRLTGWW